MELVLWLWLYDARYVFNIHPNLCSYIICWCVSIIVNVGYTAFTLYTFVMFDFVMCESNNTLKYFWVNITHKTFMSVVMGVKVVTAVCSCVHVVLLKIKHNQHLRKRMIMLFPISNVNNKECIDYFVRRYTLYHVNGIALLVLSVVNVVMGVGYVSMDYDYVCNSTITKVVKYVMWYEVGLGAVVVGVFGVAVVVKVFNFIVAYTCPKVNVCLSKWGSDQKRIKNKINFQLNKKV